MASSGSFSGSICSGHYILRVDWTQTKYVSANTSTITANIYLVNDWRLNVSSHAGNSCSIDGMEADFTAPAINGTGTYLLGTVTQAVGHNSDGSKTITISAVYAIAATISGTYYSQISASATVTLDSIPRASSVSASSTAMGSATTISISRASSSFTHTLTYAFGSASGTIATKTTSTSVSWTPPLTLANQIPSATSGTCTITCTTYNGSTTIGSKTCTLTLSVPSSVKPTIGSLTAARIDGDVPSTWGIYVRTKSKATVTIGNASGSYGSTIKSYSISGGGYSSTTSSLTTGYLNSSGTITFTATVTDSRGRTSNAATVSITVVAYSAPSFSSYTSQRCISDGTLSDDGTYVKGTVKYSYYTCSSKNSVTCATYYRAAGTSDWTDASASFTSGTAFTFGGGNISTETSYEIKYTLTDAFTTISVTDVVSTAAVVMDFKSGGKGFAIGKVSETDNCFEVSEEWDVKVYGELLDPYVRARAGQITYAECATEEATAEKVATADSTFVLAKGSIVFVKFTYTNSTTMPTLNVNGTGAKYIVTYKNYCPLTYSWKAMQTILFVYDGSFYVALALSTATTANWGITMLSTSTSSTSTSMAATPSAVKAAYDRNSWTSISLTNALALAYGGTGATTAAAARTNLGIAATSLFSGTLTTGSTTFAYGYKLYVIIGQASSSGSRLASVIPSVQITTTATAYQFADESYYYSFYLSYSGATVTLAYRSRSSSGQIIRVYGIY